MEVRGEEIVELEEARRGENVVGEVGGIGREEVDGDGEEVLAAQAPAQARLLGFDAAMLMFQQKSACDVQDLQGGQESCG